MTESVDVSKIRHIMFLGMEAGELLLYVPYDGSTDVNHDMRAALLRAIMQFSDDSLSMIRWSNFIYMFHKGETSIGLMGMSSVPDEEIYRDKLVKILHSFERECRTSLAAQDGDIRRFKDFALEIIKELPLVNMSLDTIPRRTERGDRIPWRVGEVDVSLEILQQASNGKRTIQDIIDMTQMPTRDVIALMSILAYFGWVEINWF
ncbi:MAG: hypothetical protein ACXABY_32485 [Candidatus Thorarchaeota archaeon]